ncbi:MAG TPA: glycoside hydrolase family 2 TIM barrel-domain containing protein [Ktedonobacteraceae bacterium]|nr:glycoside hydrolase family 2 TIM barrel-domain containing protein [Ktedonobacteraceae bacterium]
MRHENARCINDGWRFHPGEMAPEGIDEEALASWERVTLPHSWNALDTMEVEPGRHYTRAVGWYVREIEPAAPGERLWLEFEAAAQRASVWLNGQRIGEHLGGYTAFTVELPERLMAGAGRHWLAVRVDNLPDPDLIPSDMSDFFLYGGLTRNVWRYTTGPHRLLTLHCRSEVDASGATLSLRGALENRPGAIPYIQAELFSPSGALVAKSEQTVHDDEAFVFPDVVLPEVALWSPEQPALYTLRVTMGNGRGEIWDRVSERIGLRTFAFPASGSMTLNGQPITLHGTHRHEDRAGYGGAVPDELTRQEMRQIKAAGFNFVRLGHYPQAPAALESCDELGLLVWEELPWCRGGVGGEVFQQRALTMLAEMIDQHFNHPSLVFWGLGNELDWDSEHPDSTDEKVYEFLRTLHRFAKQRDPQRLTALRRFEPGAELVDVYSPSLWSGWYRGRYEDYEEALNAALARYPRMLHIEWGGDSHAGRYSVGPHLSATIAQESDHAERPGLATMDDNYPPRASRHGDWSESYMLDLMEWHLQVQLRTPRLAGNAQWIFKDFGTPLRPENPIPYVNQKGLVDRAGRPKALYALFQSYLTSAPMCFIEAPDWSVRSGHPGEEQRVRVYANCPRVTLFLNGASCGERRRDSAAFPAAGLVWQVRFRPGPNTLRALGVSEQGEEVEHSVTLDYYEGVAGPGVAFTWRIEPAELPGQQSGKRVTVQLVDASGQPVTSERQRVAFRLQGPGRLLDRLGTPAGSRVVELANGRASIVVLTSEQTRLLVEGASAGAAIAIERE